MSLILPTITNGFNKVSETINFFNNLSILKSEELDKLTQKLSESNTDAVIKKIITGQLYESIDKIASSNSENNIYDKLEKTNDLDDYEKAIAVINIILTSPLISSFLMGNKVLLFENTLMIKKIMEINMNMKENIEKIINMMEPELLLLVGIKTIVDFAYDIINKSIAVNGGKINFNDLLNKIVKYVNDTCDKYDLNLMKLKKKNRKRKRSQVENENNDEEQPKKKTKK